MKSKKILDALNDVDPKLIADAAPGQNRGRKSKLWIRFTAIAACVALLVVSIPVGMLLLKKDDGHSAAVSDEHASGNGESAAGGLVPGSTDPGQSGGMPGGVSGNDIDLNYLTSRIFNPNRTAGAVSDQFRAAYADLAIKLLASCRADQGSDTMISPLSILTALAMAANGADGDTLAQMEALLGGDLDIEALNQQIFNFYASLSNTENATFKAANSIWVTNQSFFTASPDFIKKMENTYDADILSIDFADRQYAADAINYWCNEKTDGMIPEIVKPDDFDDLTVMALLNALTFDAKWDDPYDDEYHCKDGVFHGTNGDTDVTMLHEYGHSGFIKGEREKGFIKKYEGGKYAFVALLPNEEGNIADYLASLDGSYLVNLIANPDNGYYSLSTQLPAFKQETSLELPEILEKLGMPDAFSNKANFRRLGTWTPPIEYVYINNVIHKTFIEVNNEGTRAAAVTAVIMDNAGGMPPARTETVILDRPFVYAIIDTATSLPIFIGSCENISG